MKSLSQTAQFTKDIRRMRKRGKDLTKLRKVVRKLANGETLDPTSNREGLTTAA